MTIAKDKGPLKKAVGVRKAKVKTIRSVLSLLINYIFFLASSPLQGKYEKRDGTTGFCGSAELKGTQSYT